MSLASGVRLGPYEIVAPIGAGGMGEVYKARDTRLDRIVAIKVLPADVAADPELRQRFEREARAVAALNHPHICTLYDIGCQDGIDYLVMEYLEGQTLAERLQPLGSGSSRTSSPAEAGRHVRGGPGLLIEEALSLAVQIAGALDAAHRAGVTHRDLKPGNIMVTKAGAKVLDFGLAKHGAGTAGRAGQAGGAGVGPTALPTMSAALTAQGTILGTLQYMAPEQLEAKDADARTDIFAFGAVLYEMLTGKRAFEGKSQASLIGAIMHMEPPPISTLQPLTPPSLDRIVKTCLAKDPDDRWQSARDLLRELRWIAEVPTGATAVGVAPPAGRRERVWVLVAATSVVAVIASLLLGAMGYLQRTSAADAPEMRLQIVTPPEASLAGFEVSPDGTKLAFLAGGQLWLRPLGSEAAQPLAGTEGTTTLVAPFWSPDNRSIGFFARGQLKRIDLDTGLVRALASAPLPVGGTWNSEGTILFAPSPSTPLMRIGASGRDLAEATRLDPPRQIAHRFPHFLPDGRRFLFFVLGPLENRGVYVGSLGSLETHRLFEADAPTTFLRPDFVVFIRDGALLAQRLNLATLQMEGDPVAVATRVTLAPGVYNAVAVSTSVTGLLAYRTHGGERQLFWVDRSGRQIGMLGSPDAAQSANLALSRDGHMLALQRTVNGNTDIWLMDVERGVPRRFTFETVRERTPVWSPDGRRIGFASERTGVFDIYERPVDGQGTETLLVASSEAKILADWSPDGRFILYEVQNPQTDRDLWVVPVTGDRKPRLVAHMPFAESAGRFSPDGRWISYQSNESGRNEIYVQPFPGPGGKSQISTSGGTLPQWRRDGREIFYLGPDNRLMAVPITLKSSTVEAGAPVALFSTPPGSEYAAAPDGQRFLVNEITEEASPITILLNWTAALKK